MQRSRQSVLCMYYFFFSIFFLSHSMHLYPFHRLSYFFHAVIILSHRDSLISFLRWLTGMSLWSRPPAQLYFPMFISILCKAMLFISVPSFLCCGYATAFSSPLYFHSQGCSPHSFNLHLWLALAFTSIRYGLIWYILVDLVYTCTYRLNSI